MKDIYKELTTQYRVRISADEAQESVSSDFDILQNTDEGDWFYALSPDRVNVIEGFPWSEDMRVLELGADYGAFAKLAGRVKSFDILEDKDERRELIKYRFKDIFADGRKPAGAEDKSERDKDLKSTEYTHKNLRVIDKAEESGYDVVIASFLDTVCNADADAGVNINAAKLISERLEKACSYLKSGGSLILIADNKNALRYMTGALREDGGCYIDSITLKELKEKLPFKKSREYYPLPDAVYARNVFSEEMPPKAGDFRGISESFAESRYVLCSEEAIYGSLCEAGAFREFAPSYMVVFTGHQADCKNVPEEEHEHLAEEKNTGDELLKKLPVYIKYNRMRAEKYALKTEIFEKSAERPVVKTALIPEADKHIEDFKKREALLRKGLSDKLSVLEAETGKNAAGRSYAAFKYLKGEDLSKKLSHLIESGKAPHKEIEEAVRLLLGADSNPCHNMDALFENVIVGEDGSCTLIDYEWVFEENLDREYLKYRVLKYWYEAYKARLTAYTGLKEFLGEFGIDQSRTEEFEEKELRFQSYVRGENKLIEEKFTKPQIYALDVRKKIDELKECRERIEILKDEISEHKEALLKERRVERLSQNHIRNIELINRNQKEQLEAMSARLNYLERHQSFKSRAAERLIRRLDAWAPAGSRKRVLIHYAKDALRHPLRMAGLILSGQGRVLISGDFEIGGEFHEGGILTLPETSNPLVSIVIPAYNQVSYTYACVRSIIANTEFDETPYEIILADDVSTDATGNIDKYIKGMVISRNSSNMGFLKNCNQAAKRARGKYIFFLNNDTKVHRNWLSSLVTLIESDESIGMVGSKLVYADGRLQEAGGIIWSDASGWNYGRLDDPEKPEYNYVKDVDYISGAAIMLSKRLWQEIGGFDERYAPAYCEDSDLAFEVRRRGKRVVFQPESVITHFEGISNGTDVNGTGLKRYQVVNNEKFKEKWAEELKEQCENNGDPDPFTARDRTQKKKCIVIVDHYVPTWDQDAGSKTTYQYIRMFIKKGFNVKFVGDNFRHDEPYSSTLQQMGVEILYGHEYENGILEWFKKNSKNIDFCYLNRPHIAVKYIDYLKKETDIKCIFYGHDLHFLRLYREYELTGDISKLRESNYWKSVELSVMQAADMVYYPSEVEIDAIHKLHPEIPARAITAYLWDKFDEGNAETAEDRKKRRDLLFVGGFKHPPNADAVKWFAKDIFPKIRAAIPEIKFLVAGSGADDDIKGLSSEEDGIRILGFVSDEELNRLYKETRLTVVPLRYGAGVKGKVVEAIYNGTVIVTTSVGAEGIPSADKVMAVVDDAPELLYEHADDVAEDFAEAVIELYKDTERCALYSSSCKGYIKEHYSLEAAWAVIEKDFDKA